MPEPSKDLAEAVRGLIREEMGKPAEETKQTERTPRQAVVLVALAVNLALIWLLLPPEWGENRLIKAVMAIVPALFGGALLAYFDEFRGWLLELCSRLRFERGMWVSLVGLVGIHSATALPIFYIEATIKPSHARVLLDGEPVDDLESSADVVSIPLPALRRYRVEIRDDTGTRPAADTLFILRREIVRASLGRIPVIGALLRPGTLRLTPKYRVSIETDGGNGQLLVQGEFSTSFLRKYKRRLRRLAESRYEFRYQVPAEDFSPVDLPAGTYDVAFVRGNCRQSLPDEVIGSSRNLVFEDLDCEGPNP